MNGLSAPSAEQQAAAEGARAQGLQFRLSSVEQSKSDLSDQLAASRTQEQQLADKLALAEDKVPF